MDDVDTLDITEEERAAAEALRRALEAPGDPPPGSDGALAAALRASAGRAEPLDRTRRDALVEMALAGGSRRGRWRTARASLAIAAAVVLGLGVPAALVARGAATPTFEYGGPTDAVFDGPFADDARASERLDQITVARTRDYFAALRGGP